MMQESDHSLDAAVGAVVSAVPPEPPVLQPPAGAPAASSDAAASNAASAGPSDAAASSAGVSEATAAASTDVSADAAGGAAPAEGGGDAAAGDVSQGDVPGILGRLKERVGQTLERVTENEKVQKALDKAKEVTQKVAESERVQQGVEYVKRKTTELAESERVQKGLELAKDTAKVVTEKTQQGLEFAKEKTQALREGAGTVWQKGRGTIEKVRTQGVSAVAWRGSARDTLANAAREEQWKNIKVQGAEELSVPARTEHTCAYLVPKGSTLRWTFRVKEHDIGFGVRMRIQQWGGSKEEEILSTERYDNADTVSGSWVADEDRTIILSFDNRYSRLRSKTVAYLVGTEKPPVFVEPPREEAAEPAS